MTVNREVRKNCTTIFMVPPFGIGKERLKNNGFIGGYLGDVNRPDINHEMGIFLLFKPNDLSAFEDFLYEERERGANIVEDYDYDGYVVLVYVLDKEFAKDYKLFLQGKYSKFSHKFKSLFPTTQKRKNKFGQTVDKPTTQYRVFRKDKELREFWEKKLDVELGPEMELWTTPDPIRGGDEWLDIDKVKEDEEYLSNHDEEEGDV